MTKMTRREKVEENRRLQRTFKAQGLPLDDVWQPNPADPDLENHQLRSLLAWVEAYRACPDRAQLAKHGFLYPPVEPGFDPDADWLRFERWMRGEPLCWHFGKEYGELRPAELLSDGEIETVYTRVVEWLAEHSVDVALSEAMPVREAYSYLRKLLAKEPFEYMPQGSFHVLDGCGGWCPDCPQQRWCDRAEEGEVEEEEEEDN